MEQRGPSSAAAKKKIDNDKNGSKASTRSLGAPRKQPRDVVPMDHVLATNVALQDLLNSLEATRPSYVIEKQLKLSDVRINQARLLFSCKGGSQEMCPLAVCFTELEAQRVEDKDEGLLVTALDRGGRTYDLTCKYLASNQAYRFIAGWTTFLEANGLVPNGGCFTRDVYVELWAFRSRALPNRFVDGEDKKKKKNRKKVHEETGSPDGALGLVLLHYEYVVEHAGDDNLEDEGVVDEEPMMPGAAPSVTRQEDLLAGVGTEQREAAAATTMSMTKDEMVAKFGEKMADAVIGMIRLRDALRARDSMGPSS